MGECKFGINIRTADYDCVLVGCELSLLLVLLALSYL